MGIIGVVAALTLPNLNSSTGDKEKVAKVKKIYQNLNDAYGRATAVYGPIDTWCSTTDDCSKRIYDRFTEFLKVTKECSRSYSSNTVCMNDIDYAYQAILSDGSAIGVEYICGNFAEFVVDIDGPNKGQQNGADIFVFKIDNDSNYNLEPYRKSNMSEYVNTLKGNCSATNSWGSCFEASGWIIDYDNMAYLKLNSSGKCPNGSTPTDDNPRCK